MRPLDGREATPGTPPLMALHGARYTGIGRLLYRNWQRNTVADATHDHVDPRALDAQQEAMAQALVHLRRTHTTRYSYYLHQSRTAAEAGRLNAHQVSVAARLAISPDTVVCILGEREPGIVIHTAIGQEPDDAWPTAWYVAAAPTAGICRAHGADEIELGISSPSRNRRPTPPSGSVR